MDPSVTARHVEMIFDKADKQLSPVRGIVIHRSPAWFMVDGGKKVLEPVGMKGSELKALVSFVVADTFFLDDVLARMRDLNITVSGFFSSSTGEAMLYLPQEERDRTAILIDVGYLCTDVMAVEGDAVIFQKTLPVGGGHITVDIASGLQINMEQAEQIKREYVYGISTITPSYSAAGPEAAKSQTFSREDVADVLEPRVDEIADMINQCIEDSGIKLGNWSNIYLTGGGLAMNRGGKDYLSARLNRPVRDTVKRTVKLSSPVYASAMGLLDLIAVGTVVLVGNVDTVHGAFHGVDQTAGNLNHALAAPQNGNFGFVDGAACGETQNHDSNEGKCNQLFHKSKSSL
jgi:cell division protein FtsA